MRKTGLSLNRPLELVFKSVCVSRLSLDLSDNDRNIRKPAFCDSAVRQLSRGDCHKLATNEMRLVS